MNVALGRDALIFAREILDERALAAAVVAFQRNLLSLFHNQTDPAGDEFSVTVN